MTSKIEWTDETWNPIIGCTKCSPGCLNCYAEKMCRRFWKQWRLLAPPHHFGVKWFPEKLDKPLHWRKPRRIFVCSMSDLFHPAVPFEFVDKVFQTMVHSPRHTYQILTKRPKRMAEWVERYIYNYNRFYSGRSEMNGIGNSVHLGVTVCTPDEKWKIETLCRIPASVRFVSFEPLLADMGEINLDGIHWCIVGAESGPKRRECKIEWIDSIVDQCKAAGVPCFVKQIHRDGRLVKMPDGYPQEYPK